MITLTGDTASIQYLCLLPLFPIGLAASISAPLLFAILFSGSSKEHVGLEKDGNGDRKVLNCSYTVKGWLCTL